MCLLTPDHPDPLHLTLSRALLDNSCRIVIVFTTSAAAPGLRLIDIMSMS